MYFGGKANVFEWQIKCTMFAKQMYYGGWGNIGVIASQSNPQCDCERLSLFVRFHKSQFNCAQLCACDKTLTYLDEPFSQFLLPSEAPLTVWPW